MNLFPDQNTLDHREKEAINRVLERGRLSYYRGTASPEFYGGPEIQNLEKKWSERWGSKYSIACNSATSGLHIACGAIGLKPGDEVIVTPWSMTCSATAPLIYGAIPVFADIEKDYFCLDPDSVESRITERTKAIIVVDLFGQGYDPRLNEIAEKHNLFIVEDAAQAVGSKWTKIEKHDNPDLEATRYGGAPFWYIDSKKYAGTFGHIGVYSFNFGKHLTCGEGGMIVTDDPILNAKCRLLMNHAESVVNDDNETCIEIFPSLTLEQYTGLVGFNMRMTEIQAAIALVQLDKFDELQKVRMENVSYLNDKLSEFDFIEPVKIRPGFTHTYYALPYLFSQEKAGTHRDQFIEKVKSKLAPRAGRDGEGVQIGCGYIKPIYLMPLFQERKHWAFNNIENLHDCKGLPYHLFSRSECNNSSKELDCLYGPGSCPTCEKLWKDELFLTLMHSPNSTINDMGRVYRALKATKEKC